MTRVHTSETSLLLRRDIGQASFQNDVMKRWEMITNLCLS